MMSADFHSRSPFTHILAPCGMILEESRVFCAPELEAAGLGGGEPLGVAPPCSHTYMDVEIFKKKKGTGGGSNEMIIFCCAWRGGQEGRGGGLRGVSVPSSIAPVPGVHLSRSGEMKP